MVDKDYLRYKDGTPIDTRFTTKHNNEGLDTVAFMASPASSHGMQIQIYSIALNRFVEFAAFVTNFSDTYSSNYESTEAMGRMDPILNFKNTTRTMSLSFDVPSLSLKDARENMSEINALIQFLYPTYQKAPAGKARVMSGSPLVKIQFQNLIASGRATNGKTSYHTIPIKAQDRGLIAAITSLNSTPDLEQGTFGSTFDLQAAIDTARALDQISEEKRQEINKADPASAAAQSMMNLDLEKERIKSGEAQMYGMQFPKLWKIDMSLTILHDHMTGHDSGGFEKNGQFPYYSGFPRKQDTVDSQQIDVFATYNALPKPPPNEQVEEEQPTKAEAKDTEKTPEEKLAVDGVLPEAKKEEEVLEPLEVNEAPKPVDSAAAAAAAALKSFGKP